jgi:hypothetical protein
MSFPSALQSNSLQPAAPPESLHYLNYARAEYYGLLGHEPYHWPHSLRPCRRIQWITRFHYLPFGLAYYLYGYYRRVRTSRNALAAVVSFIRDASCFAWYCTLMRTPPAGGLPLTRVPVAN